MPYEKDALAYFHFEENDYGGSFHSYNGERTLSVSADTIDISTSDDYGYALDCQKLATLGSTYKVYESAMSVSGTDGYTIAFRMKAEDNAYKGIIVSTF